MSYTPWMTGRDAAERLAVSYAHLNKLMRTDGAPDDAPHSVTWRGHVIERAPSDGRLERVRHMWRIELPGALEVIEEESHAVARHSLLDLLPAPQPVPEVTVRQAITILCNEVASATGTAQEDLWRELYEASRVFDGVDIRRRSKNAKKAGSKHTSHLEYAEREGCLDALYARAHHIWGGRL